MGEHLNSLTHFTVKGNSLESNFYIKIEVSLQSNIVRLFLNNHYYASLFHLNLFSVKHINIRS